MCTFVVDATGHLRLADRHSEHVACAGGGEVLAAGEISFASDNEGWFVADVTNQSTGYCPEPASWIAVAHSLDALGVRHAGGFTNTLVHRRCNHCGERNVVKDDYFVCDICGETLPPIWNFED